MKEKLRKMYLRYVQHPKAVARWWFIQQLLNLIRRMYGIRKLYGTDGILLLVDLTCNSVDYSAPAYESLPMPAKKRVAEFRHYVEKRDAKWAAWVGNAIKVELLDEWDVRDAEVLLDDEGKPTIQYPVEENGKEDRWEVAYFGFSDIEEADKFLNSLRKNHVEFLTRELFPDGVHGKVSEALYGKYTSDYVALREDLLDLLVTIAKQHQIDGDWSGINKDAVESFPNINDLKNNIVVFADGSGVRPSYVDGKMVALTPEQVDLAREEAKQI